MHFLAPNPTYGHERHGTCPHVSTLVYGMARCCHRGLSTTERVFLSCHQSNVPNPPLMQTQIKRSRLSGTQMWNVSAELHLRQRPLRGFLFPESHNTDARRHQSRHERSRSVLEAKHEHVSSVYLSKPTPIRAPSDQTEE